MKIYRTHLHGHIIEARQGDLGCDRVLVDGKVVSTKYLGGWYGASHFVEIEDEAGKVRHVEISWIDRSRLKIGKYRMCLTVDGVVRGQVEPTTPGLAPGSCTHCGYSLEGLNAVNGEVRCPECGRHTSAALIDMPD